MTPPDPDHRHRGLGGSRSHRDDDTSALVSSLDLTVRVGNLLHRVDAVDDGFQLARFDESRDELEAFARVAADGILHLLASAPRGAKGLPDFQKAAVERKVRAILAERVLALGE